MIALWRLDDRLLHGQVLVVLIPKLSINSVIAVSESTASNEFKQELFRLATPPELSLLFVGIEEAGKLYPVWGKDDKKHLLLFEKPVEMLRLAELVGPPSRINLANLGMRDGRTMVFESLSLDKEERESLDKLTAMKCELYYQQVPNSESMPYIGITR